MRILAGATTALRRIVDLALVGLILVVLLAVVLGKGAPLVARQTIVIGGGSMEPAIGLGAAIVVRKVDTGVLAVGDVVSMQVGPDQATVTHRIIAVVDRPDGRWIRTQGDANATPDPTLVPANAVFGRVEFVLPLVGYLLALLSLPMGVMFVLGLAATLLAIAWLLESLELDRRPTVRHAPAGAPGAFPAAAFRPALTSPEPAPPIGEPIAARGGGRGGGEGRTGGGGRRGLSGLLARRRSASRAGATIEAIARATGIAPSVAVGRAARPAARPAAGRPTVVATADVEARPVPSFEDRTRRHVPREGVARPTVREQLDRSRATRDRRARWLMGRGAGRPATD